MKKEKDMSLEEVEKRRKKHSSNFINEKGNKYGKLSVIERDNEKKSVKVYWICKCDCGKTVSVDSLSLRRGSARSCPECSLINIEGNRYGKLLVIKRDIKFGGDWGWLCLCDCGNTSVVRMSSLRNGNTSSCGCSIYKQYGEAARNSLYNDYVQEAKPRNLVFSLSRELFNELTSSNCFYCGVEPRQIKKAKNNNGDYIYNGIDRKDNNEGYTPENCLPCCGNCNRAKRTLSFEDFMEWGIRFGEESIRRKNGKK